jgi:diaminopimelate epimerase
VTRNMHFTKMQGLGNDFIVVEGPATFTAEEITRLCDRRFGIGADGVLVVTHLDPVRMEYWNADGSAAEMCGNGLRCVARYVYDRGWVADRDFTVQTPIGVRGARVLEDTVEVELGRVLLGETRTIEGTTFKLVDVGNPHAVVFVDDPAQVDVLGVGKSLQSGFDTGTNVEFARVTDGGITMRVWERGVGETLACGTGMAAVVAAAQADGLGSGPIEVDVPGGRATLDMRDGVAWIRGPAEYSFRGSVGEQ